MITVIIKESDGYTYTVENVVRADWHTTEFLDEILEEEFEGFRKPTEEEKNEFYTMTGKTDSFPDNDCLRILARDILHNAKNK